ncbi:MAG: hypothetical protein NTW52_18045 [Planctomycetota bacterium]|nr:hypothetical protein [Planctomycetota bacterium]
MSDTDYRVIDDLGEPSLYPRSYFLEDRLEPPLEWITKNFDEGEYWAIPNELSARRLFEDFFDGNKESIATIKAFAERAARQSDGQ